jgi:hypothetical protein
MVLAISLFKVVSSQEEVDYRALENVEGIRNIYNNSGDDNLFLVLEAENMDSFTRILNHIKEVCPAGVAKMIGCRQIRPC